MKSLTRTQLIAPCGINCAVCRAHLRQKNNCPGCRAPDHNKAPGCVRCAIKNCEALSGRNRNFCFQCSAFPCDRLRRLDKRYRTRYATNPIHNLEFIRDHGVRQFARNEIQTWACPACHGTICMHTAQCAACQTTR